MGNIPVQLSTFLDHRNLGRVIGEAKRILGYWYGSGVTNLVKRVFKLTAKVFQGKMRGYQACSTDYHDHGHTVDVFVAAVRLIDGYRISGTVLSPEIAADICIAALLHDIGYILETGDKGGTGAKYTRSHVRRGVGFLKVNASSWGIPEERVPFIARLIFGTDLALAWSSINYTSEEETTAGAILATADLMGQMADRAYLEKLLFLYYEFEEAGFDQYQTAFDVLKSTEGFYLSTRKRLDSPLLGAYQKLQVHFAKRHGQDVNFYLQSIERQLDFLRKIMEDASSNFRKKLKRLDLDKMEKRHTPPRNRSAM